MCQWWRNTCMNTRGSTMDKSICKWTHQILLKGFGVCPDFGFKLMPGPHRSWQEHLLAYSQLGHFQFEEGRLMEALEELRRPWAQTKWCEKISSYLISCPSRKGKLLVKMPASRLCCLKKCNGSQSIPLSQWCWKMPSTPHVFAMCGGVWVCQAWNFTTTRALVTPLGPRPFHITKLAMFLLVGSWTLLITLRGLRPTSNTLGKYIGEIDWQAYTVPHGIVLRHTAKGGSRLAQGNKLCLLKLRFLWIFSNARKTK